MTQYDDWNYYIDTENGGYKNHIADICKTFNMSLKTRRKKIYNSNNCCFVTYTERKYEYLYRNQNEYYNRLTYLSSSDSIIYIKITAIASGAIIISTICYCMVLVIT